MPQLSVNRARKMFESHLDLVERILRWANRRYRFSPQDAEEFRSFVFLKLVRDDYAVLRKFRGQSSLRTYLTTVVLRLGLDFRNKIWGKWRPSAAAKRMGKEALQLERLISRDGHSVFDAIEILKVSDQVTSSRQALERIASRLPKRAKRQLEGGDVVLHLVGEGQADDRLWRLERNRIIGGVKNDLETLVKKLPKEDRQVLELRFNKGLKISQIATVLGLKQRNLYSRLERCLRAIRQELEAAGVSGREVLEAISEQ